MAKKKHDYLTVEEKRTWLADIFRDSSGEYSQADKFKAMIEDTRLAMLAEEASKPAPPAAHPPRHPARAPLPPPSASPSGVIPPARRYYSIPEQGSGISCAARGHTFMRPRGEFHTRAACNSLLVSA